MQDVNLAGLATLAGLAFFFPGCGLLGLRRRRIEARKAHQAEQLKQLMREEEKRLARMVDHVCTVDLDACRTNVNDEGHVFGACSVCGHDIYIGLASVREWSRR